MNTNKSGRDLAYSYLDKIINNTRPSTEDLKILILEIVRLEDMISRYRYDLQTKETDNRILYQENKFLTRELERYEK